MLKANELLGVLDENYPTVYRVFPLNKEYILVRTAVDDLITNRLAAFIRTEREIGVLFDSGLAQIISNDPVNELLEEYKELGNSESRDRNWDLIRPIVELGSSILVSKQRTVVIRQRSKETNESEHMIRRWLRQFYQAGQNKDALGSGFGWKEPAKHPLVSRYTIMNGTKVGILDLNAFPSLVALSKDRQRHALLRGD